VDAKAPIVLSNMKFLYQEMKAAERILNF